MLCGLNVSFIWAQLLKYQLKASIVQINETLAELSITDHLVRDKNRFSQGQSFQICLSQVNLQPAKPALTGVCPVDGRNH